MNLMKNKSASNSKSEVISETKKNLVNSWRLYRENSRAFIATELFAIIAFIITSSIIIIIGYLIENSSATISFTEYIMNFSSNYQSYTIYKIFIALFILTILTGWLNCQYGLAFDIMSSGEMYAEFSGSFNYFKRHWWQYILSTVFIFSFWLTLPPLLRLLNGYGPFESTEPGDYDSFEINMIFIIIYLILFFFWFIIFINLFPSITAQGSLKRAFIESIRIARKNIKHMIKTWLSFFLLVLLPLIFLIALDSLIFDFINPPNTGFRPVFIVIGDLASLFLLFVGYPISTLIATGIYNNTDFERFNPIETTSMDKNDESEIKKIPEKNNNRGIN
jgi:hypothetical protein